MSCFVMFLVLYVLCVPPVFAVPTASVSTKIPVQLQTFLLTTLPNPFGTEAQDAALLSAYIAGRRPQLSEATRNILVESLLSEAAVHGVDPKLVAAIMSVESGFNPHAYNRGAIGLGQLMRGTAARLGVKDPYSVTQNVAGTTQYVAQMLAYWEGHPQQVPLALSSYLMGPLAAKRQESSGFGKKAHAYVKHVLNHYRRISEQ